MFSHPGILGLADFLSLLYVMFSCVFFSFPYDILGQVWYLIVSIPDLCRLLYFCNLTLKSSAEQLGDNNARRILKSIQKLEFLIKLYIHKYARLFYKRSLYRKKNVFQIKFSQFSSACATTELSILLTSCLTAIKKHVIKYCTTVYERNGKNLFWSIKNSGEILNKLKSRGFLASGLSTYDFSTLYTTLPHNLIKEKLTELIEQTFNREGSLYVACNDKNALFTSEQPKRYKLWSCQKM